MPNCTASVYGAFHHSEEKNCLVDDQTQFLGCESYMASPGRTI